MIINNLEKKVEPISIKISLNLKNIPKFDNLEQFMETVNQNVFNFFHVALLKSVILYKDYAQSNPLYFKNLSKFWGVSRHLTENK